MSKCILLHGCPDVESDKTFNKHWMPWLKQSLEENGFTVEAPIMPRPWAPNYEAFKEVFDKIDFDDDTVIVAHSCGCAFIVRWLGDNHRQLEKLILVAPWKIPDNDSERSFYIYDIHPSIKNRIKKIIYFTSNDEHRHGKESMKIYHRFLGGKIISISNHGHFIEGHMGKNDFPELLDEILE